MRSLHKYLDSDLVKWLKNLYSRSRIRNGKKSLFQDKIIIISRNQYLEDSQFFMNSNRILVLSYLFIFVTVTENYTKFFSQIRFDIFLPVLFVVICFNFQINFFEWLFRNYFQLSVDGWKFYAQKMWVKYQDAYSRYVQTFHDNRFFFVCFTSRKTKNNS